MYLRIGLEVIRVFPLRRPLTPSCCFDNNVMSVLKTTDVIMLSQFFCKLHTRNVRVCWLFIIIRSNDKLKYAIALSD